MDDTPIIGPFTAKQFVVVAGGAGLAYLIMRFLFSPLSLPLIILVVWVTFSVYRRVSPPKIDEKFIRGKRYKARSLEEYQAWVRTQIAVTQSQIRERERKGFVRDPELDRRIELLDTILKEGK